jgi:hypothetical protein
MTLDVAVSADSNMGQGAEKPEDVQEPQDNDDDHDSVQDGLDRSLHGDVAVDEPQQDSYDDQNDHDVNQRHERPPCSRFGDPYPGNDKLTGGVALYMEASRAAREIL